MERKTSNIPILTPLLRAHRTQRPLSFAGKSWSDMEQWKSLGKGKVMELLHYDPEPAPLAPEVHARSQRDGYRLERISFQSGAGIRIPACLLIPDGTGPFPAVAALHDHGGIYYWGKERIVDTGDKSGPLNDYVRTGYDGVFWATELAKRGYVVLVIDAFYFGERRLVMEDLPGRLRSLVPDLAGLEPGSDEYALRFNAAAAGLEYMVERTLRFAGIEWPAVLCHDDRRSIDYLCSRPEVLPGRIGCCGLSLGGFRSAMLTGLDSRIQCGVAAGWMVSYDSLLPGHCDKHTHMVSIHGLPDYMDLPDMAALGFPTPLLVQQCARDELYSVAGMEQANEAIRAIYRAGGAEERFDGRFYDHGHQFCGQMRRDAFAWLDRWLKGDGAE